eukprot:PITA_11196
MAGPLLPSNRANICTVTNPTEKRYRTEDLLKENVKISACPEMNCQAMKPKKLPALVIETVKAGDHKELQKKKWDSSRGEENGSKCTSLSNMVRGFVEFDSHCNGDGESCSDNEPVNSHYVQLLEDMVSCKSAAELRLLGCVNYALKNKENMVVNCSKSNLCKEVMKNLKLLGYNAGICKSLIVKTRDSHIPLGDYEYMDVIMKRSEGKSKEERLLVDIDFRAQFEIARPTKQYSTMVRLLPNVFVGKEEKLKNIIKIMCDAARRSLKKKAMHIPPWREYRYVRSKWLGSYRRTTNSSGSDKPAEPPQQKGFEINFHRLDLEEGRPPLPNVEAKIPAMNKGGKVSGLTTAFKRAGLANSSSKVQLMR